ncbi:MAG: hypothetical protein V1816_09550 [Pseudomonadota bacterium]
MPNDMIFDMPKPAAMASYPKSVAAPPLWDIKAVEPGSLEKSDPGSRVTPPLGECRPKQLGPMIRRPARAMSASSDCKASPSAVPNSPNPDEWTWAPARPCSRHSRSTPATPSAGTEMEARSTGPSTSPRDL